MMTVRNLVWELKMERDRTQKRLAALNAALSAFAGAYGVETKTTKPATRKPAKLSAEAKEKIAAAQRERWAKAKEQKTA
ncbi:MAG TPA: hypothetical protein VND65_06560 [Candidatus Binatia bacterium]|nr:hypothetical protein [Candidatus Binatia bacterium]